MSRPVTEELDEVKKVQVVRFPVGGSLLWIDYPTYVNEKRFFPEKLGLAEGPSWRTPLAPLTWSCIRNRYALDAVMESGNAHRIPFDPKFLSNRTCSLIWSKHPKGNAKLFYQLQHHQRFNHIPGSTIMTRKDSLAKLLSEMKKNKKLQAEFDFFPETFALPEQSKDFRKRIGLKRESILENPDVRSAKRHSAVAYNKHRSDRFSKKLSGSEDVWIFKPAYSAKGKDIAITSSLGIMHKIKRSLGDSVVQQYIRNPLLINGKKFNIRVYVLVTGFAPLKVYFYPEGIVEFCGESYEAIDKHLGQSKLARMSSRRRDVNLKHVSNLKGPKYKAEESLWNFEQLKEELGDDLYEDIFDGIKDIVIKTCLAASKHVKDEELDLGHEFEDKAHLCFELFGFDILVDSDYKPWLIEVNQSPSLASPTDEIRIMKTKLLCDTLFLVGLPYKHENKREQLLTTQMAKTKKRKGIVKSLKHSLSRNREQSRRGRYTSWSTNNQSRSLFGMGGDPLYLEEVDARNRANIALVCEEFVRMGKYERLFPPMPGLKSKDYISLMNKSVQYVNCLVKDFEAQTFDLLFDQNIEEFDFSSLNPKNFVI